MPSSTIQWFPGHMAKARRQMEENLKKVDFIIEIRDARMPFSSRNPLIDELAKGKPRLVLLSKMDKADPELTRRWIEALEDDQTAVMAVDLVKGGFKNKVISRALALNAPLIEKQKKRGIRPRALRAMVAGIPNVGKSTFINSLAGRKAAVTGDRPGVTISLQWIKASSELEVLDTPGVLWPKFESQRSGLVLAALGSIKDDVVHMDDLALFCAQYLSETLPDRLLATYKIEKIEETPWQTLEAIARKRGWLQKGSVDENRTMRSFIQDIRSGKLGRITWEIPQKADEPSDPIKETQADSVTAEDQNEADQKPAAQSGMESAVQ